MNKICFTPFPSIATERFNLRPLTIEDENEIFALRSDDSINEYLDRPKANSIDDARKFIYKIIEGISQDESIFWVISSKDNPALAATICLWKISKEHATAEIGYEVLPRFQGKGIMQEVIPKIIEYGFETLKLTSRATSPYSSCKQCRIIGVILPLRPKVGNVTHLRLVMESEVVALDTPHRHFREKIAIRSAVMELTQSLLPTSIAPVPPPITP